MGAQTAAWNQFNTDEAALNNDALVYEQSIQDSDKAKAAFTKAVDSIKTGNPQEAIMLLFMLIAGQGSAVLNGDLAAKGEALKIQGDLTSCDNDIQAFIQAPDNTGTDTPITDAADMLDGLMNYTGSVSHATSGLPASNVIAGIKAALGGTTVASLNGQYVAMRNTMTESGDANGYNPPEGSSYFQDNVSGQVNGKIGSFDEMRSDMSKQGDAKQANEADQVLVNAENTNTSTTQSSNAALGQGVTEITNAIKAVIGLVTDGLHSSQDLSKAAINNMSRG